MAEWSGLRNRVTSWANKVAFEYAGSGPQRRDQVLCIGESVFSTMRELQDDPTKQYQD